jgi:hypothetical protein
VIAGTLQEFLEPLHAAADDLVAHLNWLGQDVQIARRLIPSDTRPFEGD